MSITTGKASNRTSSCWGKWVVTKLMWWISRLVIYDVRQPRPWQHVSTMPDLFLDFASLWKKYDKNRNTMCWWMAIVVGAGHELWRQRVAGRVAWCCCLVVSWERVSGAEVKNKTLDTCRLQIFLLSVSKLQRGFWGVVSVASSSTIL